MSATITKQGNFIRIQANGANIPGLPCSDQTINISNIITIQKFMDNVALNAIQSDKIVIKVGQVSDIGGTTDLDSTMKIRNALMTLITT